MKKSIVIICGLAIMSSCGSENTKTETSKTTEEVKEQTKIDVTPNSMLTMEISGMSCEHACGGSIREGLIETGGVSRVQYDFEMGRDVNTAKISFDNTKISEDEMIKLVSKLNDKQFKVGKTAISKISSAEDDTVVEKTSPSKSTERSTTSVKETSFEFPNLFDILSSIVM